MIKALFGYMKKFALLTNLQMSAMMGNDIQDSINRLFDSLDSYFENCVE